MHFEIRDEKTVYNKVENPAVVFDRETGTLHRIGERETMVEYFNTASGKYRDKGFHAEADSLTYMELPKNQAVIDKVFQNTGYIKILHDAMFAKAN